MINSFVQFNRPLLGIFEGNSWTGVSVRSSLADLSFAEAYSLTSFSKYNCRPGIGGWIYYGILKGDYPIIFTNIFSFVVNVLTIVFSFKYKKA